MKRFYFKLRSILFISLLISTFFSAKSQSQLMSGDKLSLLFIGDIMGHDEQIWSAENRETHTFNYDDVFRYVKPILSEADIAIANFEVTLAGPPYLSLIHISEPTRLGMIS